MSFELPYRKQSTAPVLVMCLLCLLLSWGGECSLGGLRCNHRKWWRTWPPPPQLGWQPGRSGTCPAPCLAERQEQPLFRYLSYALLPLCLFFQPLFSPFPHSFCLVFPSYTGCLHSLKISMICCGLYCTGCRGVIIGMSPRLILFVVHLLRIAN